MSQPKLILYIEDEAFTVEWLTRIVEERFSSQCQLVNVRSEREFLLQQEELAKKPFAGVILDIILPWENGVPESESGAFKEPRGSIYEAGIRIYEDLMKSTVFCSLPVLVYSVTDEDRLKWPAELQKPSVMSKQAPDFKLIEWIRRSIAEPDRR
jgi:hypothetical protein